jgi:hypothetical protein
VLPALENFKGPTFHCSQDLLTTLCFFLAISLLAEQLYLMEEQFVYVPASPLWLLLP